MAIRQYIGARYTPKFMGTYDNTQSYEVLSVVDNGSGTSYINGKPAPAGTPLTDTNYWHIYGASSGAIINLQNQIGDLTDLDTTDKDCLVDAINENVNEIQTLSTNQGTLSNLLPSASNLVDAINETYKAAHIFDSVADMISSTLNFVAGDIIAISNGSFFKVVNSSNAITKTLHNGKYAELLPDADGFYHIGALALSNWADIYPILSYLFTNEKYLIFIENGNYTMSDTLLLDVATTPQIQIVGESKTKTFIKCTKGFLKVNVVGGGFRASVIKNLHLEGTATGAVGGDYYGIQIQWKTTDANNMIDYLNISDLMMQYFNIALLLSGRVIWNNFTNLTLRYNKIAFQFSNNDSAAFFNNNVFINCEFDANLNYGIVLAGKEGQAVSNVFVGCSIEGNNYGDTTSGNLTEMVINRCSAKFESCHFEKASGVTNFVAVVPTKSCVSFDGCMFLNYSGHMLTNTESTAVFEACTISNCSQTVYGTDTGTTVFSHSHVIV